MNTQNISTLKIHKLTQEQYDRELAAGRIDENALYLTPDESSEISITHSWDGTILTVTSASGTSSADLKGEKGDKGTKGDTGANGITPHVGSNGNWFIGETDTGIPATGPAGGQGLPGTPGEDGKDGTSVTVKSVSESTADGGSNVVTFSDGKTLTVKNGSKGSAGDKGDKGDKGNDGVDGYTPVKGVDYYTDADKTEMVNAVIAALPVYNGEVV